jgi:anti-sigma regulatory factor (Ser/Thr protein kinase)
MPTAPPVTLLEKPVAIRSDLVRRRDFAASLVEAAATVAWIERIAEEQKWPHRVAFAIQVCAEELLTNIVYHGAAESTDIAVELAEGVNQVQMTIEDHGPPFDIATAVRRRVDRPLEELEPGGLGVQLVHHFSDHLSYQRRGDANCMIAVFKLPEPESSAP